MREEDDPIHIVQELFAVMTALCEDGGDIAHAGQHCTTTEKDQLANRLHEIGSRLQILAKAVRTIPVAED